MGLSGYHHGLRQKKHIGFSPKNINNNDADDNDNDNDNHVAHPPFEHFTHEGLLVDQKEITAPSSFEGYEPNAMSKGGMHTPSEKDLQLALIEELKPPEPPQALGPPQINPP